jgi:hypothetical protein
MAKLSDLEKQLEEKPPKAGIAAVKTGREALASGLSEQATKTLNEATKTLVSAQGLKINETAAALVAAQMKPLSEAMKKLGTVGLFGRQSAIADAMKSANTARNIVGQVDLDVERTLLPSPEIRWRAETAAASVATRDAVFALADAVDTLAESSERSSRRLIVLAFASAILSAAVVVLTALLVF